MGQAPSTPSNTSSPDAPASARTPRQSFSIGQRRSPPENDSARERREATPQRRIFGSFLGRRTPNSNSPDDALSDPSVNSSVPEMPPRRQQRHLNRQNNYLDDPPSLISMEEPTSTRHLNVDDMNNLSSSDLTVGQSNRDHSGRGEARRLNRSQPSDRSLDAVPPLRRYDSDGCASPPAHSRDDASFRTPEPSHMDSFVHDDHISSASAVNLDASAPDSMFRYFRRASAGSMASGTSVSDEYSEMESLAINSDFYPQGDQQWMGRSIETLILGYRSTAPILRIVEVGGNDPYYFDDGYEEGEFTALRRRSTASTFGGYGRRRSSQGSFPGGRRGSLSLSGGQGHGGTLASYYRRRGPPSTPNEFDRPGRRGSTTTGHVRAFRRRSSMAAGGSDDGQGATTPSSGKKGGPNACLSVMARESTGKSFFLRGTPIAEALRMTGGLALYSRIDKPSAGIANEVAFLAAAIDSGDLSETQTIIARLAPRLIGDPMGSNNGAMDPNLPPTAPRYYAGGGRVGLERDAFVLADGVGVLIKVFTEKSFVGQEMSISFDARDLSSEIVATRLALCWNEALAILRELVFSIPTLVTCTHLDDGIFIPFLFSLLAHDSTFDAAAALIEEILAILSQSPNQPAPSESIDSAFQPTGRVSPPTTFFLGNVPNLYELWNGFSCRQLAHFCRILALLVFEPEDRQLLESPAVLKSLELLRLRRCRALRAGRDATVDLNQSILLGDEELLTKLLQLLRMMNFAPGLHNPQPFHVMAQYPFIADTLVMLGLGEIDSWSEIDRQERLARRLQEDAEGDEQPALSELGSVATMLENLGETLGEPSNQIGSIIQVISAAQQAGVIVGRGRNRTDHTNDAPSEEDQATAAAALRLGGMPVDTGTIQGLASVAGILSDQMLVRRLYDSDEEPTARHFIGTPEDAANSLQFNGIILCSYQVEVLFVLCTLLGGRRKWDAQHNLCAVIPILEDMFHRLPFSRENDGANRSNESATGHGVHGPGCDCTPESALCVQFLRLIHNFCDRDVDNYSGRRLLLSSSEHDVIFNATEDNDDPPTPGLLSKLVTAFMKESDESPYRFWLASCIESFLRGSSPEEQIFVASSGLMKHLITEISSSKLHCAGSLQTSFDILGELTKGNPRVVRLLMSELDEDLFRRVFSVATGNLIDSNVFIRSLILTVERLAAEHNGAWTVRTDDSAYLTHSWLDIAGVEMQKYSPSLRSDESIPSEWFTPPTIPSQSRVGDEIGHSETSWVFMPSDGETASLLASNTVQRLAWFLEKNKATLLRALMKVVRLQNINHENICVLNTAIVVTIFAHRRKQLEGLLEALRRNPDEDLVSQFAELDLDERPSDILRNFREVLWFWTEYYTHRGRDRLSLEFSSHVRFQEWSQVVALLTADDGTPTSLCRSPIRLPRSPYRRAARGVDSSFPWGA